MRLCCGSSMMCCVVFCRVVSCPPAFSVDGYRQVHSAHALYEVIDTGDAHDFAELGTAPFAKTLLDQQKILLVDEGHNLYLWVGSEVSAARKKGSMSAAEAFLQQKGRGKGHNAVQRELAGHESDAFMSNFEQKCSGGHH
mmetsp:Transcript_61921/g.146623  ORF Transcript_61921/g.146623 Transcript_61921/m.146623 type:complete len:140 (+) Transcript_61921:1050-1469(+)